MILVLSPHNDDETLFAAFTILKHRAHVVVCHGSAGDYGSTADRMMESAQAVATLGGSFEQWEVPSGDANLLHSKLVNGRSRDEVIRVFAPDRMTTHPDHRPLLAEVAADVFKGKLTTYHTYKTIGDVPYRMQSPRPVEMGHPSWAHRKLRALSSYTTQATHPRANVFFLQDQTEYYGVDA